MCAMSRICSLKLPNLSLARAVGSAGLWVIGAALCPVSPAGHTFEWADTGQHLCVQTRDYAFFSPRALNSCWQTNLRLPSQSLLLFLSLSLSKDRLTWWRRSCSVLFPFTFGIGVCVSVNRPLLFFYTETLVTEERVHNLLPYNFYFYLITFFLSSHLWCLSFSPPSSHSWKSISGHTMRAEGGERRNSPPGTAPGCPERPVLLWGAIVRHVSGSLF